MTVLLTVRFDDPHPPGPTEEITKAARPQLSELETTLQAAGLGEWAPRLAELARHCIIFVPGAIEEGDAAPIGASRLGGRPDLPPDVDWPIRPPLNVEDTAVEDAAVLADRVVFGPLHWLHRLFRTQDWKRVHERLQTRRESLRQVRNRAWPLSFVGQIDFAEVHLVRALDGFPTAGRLSFFCDPTTGHGSLARSPLGRQGGEVDRGSKGAKGEVGLAKGSPFHPTHPGLVHCNDLKDASKAAPLPSQLSRGTSFIDIRLFMRPFGLFATLSSYWLRPPRCLARTLHGGMPDGRHPLAEPAASPVAEALLSAASKP